MSMIPIGDVCKRVIKRHNLTTKKIEKITFELVKINKKKAVMLIQDPRNTFTLIYDTPWVRDNFAKQGRLTRHGMKLWAYDAEMAYNDMKHTGNGRAYGEKFENKNVPETIFTKR
jgi:hypothetical protein